MIDWGLAASISVGLSVGGVALMVILCLWITISERAKR